MKYYFSYTILIGNIYITEDDKQISYIGVIKPEKTNKKETDLIKTTVCQINEYLSGKRKNFDIPLKFTGTYFQQKVWNELLKIPYGETTSYKYIAEKINNPRGYRAVAQACNKNKHLIVIPCHRVIGCNNNLIGYSAGLDVKKKLLKLESY